MGPPLVVGAVLYISGHGFGHASRAIELIGALRRRVPGIDVTIRSAVARRFFAAVEPIAIEPADVDTGLTQIDSLQIDEAASARRAAAFYRGFDRRVAEEAAAIARLRVRVVVADNPPVALAAASRAGVPSVAVANFTWDWIYQAYDAFPRLAPGVIDVIRGAYAKATLALRLPMHGGFDGIREVRDIPFIARTSTRGREETRRLLGLDGPSGGPRPPGGSRPIVLPSFGAYGAAVPWDALEQSGHLAVVRSDAAMDRHGLLYQDLVAAADVVVSKPGYGIVSECIANGAALLYTSRGRFPEQDVFVAEMPRILRCRPLTRDDFLAGRWDADVDALLKQPAPASRPRLDGADVAAAAIANFLDR